MKLEFTAVFLWLGTFITIVSAVDLPTRQLPSVSLMSKAHYYNQTQLYRRTAADYDNGLYDRDLVDLEERSQDDSFIIRALMDKLPIDKRDFDGDNINKRQADIIVTAGKTIWKIFEGIKNQIQNEKDARGKYTSTLAGRLCGAKPQYNWLIIRSGNVHWDGVRGKDWGHKHVEFPLHFFGRTTGFDIYYGKSGKVERKGDGGWLNWGFCGRFERKNDRFVTFFKP